MDNTTLIKELVKLADQLDLQGKEELAAKVDETIEVFAARPKAPLKKMDEKVKKDLLKFLGSVAKHLEDSVKALEELFRRMRYFGIDHELKGLDLEESFKDMKKLHNCMDGAGRKFYEYSFGRKPSRDYLKDVLKEDQDADDPFEFARLDPAQNIPERLVPKEDVSLVGADKEAPTEEEMKEFWDKAELEEEEEGVEG